MSVRPADYKMSFGTGGLFVNESIAVVRLHIHGEPWSATLQRSIDLGATSLPKAASNRRVLREIVNRVSCLADVERLFLVDEADRPEQEALLWIATCRCYTFIEEFTLEVIQDRFLSLRLDLPIESFDHFFDSKAEEDAGLAMLSSSTRLKLRQVLFRMMREAGIVTVANQIRPAYLSGRFRALISETRPSDLSFFPGIRPD